ncbi:MAG: SDR family NAD(P)-dependent oxidoreductase [Acidimicrobiia bacterium]
MDLGDRRRRDRVRVAIVTGASRGIGRQVALGLARRGMAVVVAARTVEPPEAAAPMEVTVKTIVHVVADGDPMRYTGRVLRTQELVAELGL